MAEKEYLKYFKGYFTPFYDIVKMDFESFSTEITQKDKPLFKSLIKSSFTKCFEFNYYNSRKIENKESFFLLGTLRSICEDLITLSYLKTLKAKDRNEFIQFNLDFDITKNLIVQKSFFEKYNKGQLTIDPINLAGKPFCDFVHKTKKKQDLKKEHKVYPSVFFMANKTNYKDLYNFLYYATSSLVHFRADTLLKLGWNSTIEDAKKNRYKYSIENYNHYYTSFNLVYGSLLFCEFVRRFKKELGLSDTLIQSTEYFRSSFDLFDWPEIVTHEHLSLEKPSHSLASLYRAIQTNNHKHRTQIK